jgi:hypothetical protein
MFITTIGIYTVGKRKGFYAISIDNFDQVELFQDSVGRALNPILSSEIWDGVLLRDVYLEAGVLARIKHRLGRELVGYIVVQKNANASIWDEQSTNNQRDLFLNLQTSADCKVSIWVF